MLIKKIFAQFMGSRLKLVDSLMNDLISGSEHIMEKSSFCLMIENEITKSNYLIDLYSMCSARSVRHNVSPWNRSVTHHTYREVRHCRFP